MDKYSLPESWKYYEKQVPAIVNPAGQNSIDMVKQSYVKNLPVKNEGEIKVIKQSEITYCATPSMILYQEGSYFTTSGQQNNTIITIINNDNRRIVVDDIRKLSDFSKCKNL